MKLSGLLRRWNVSSDPDAVSELANLRIVTASTFTMRRCGFSRYRDWAR